MDTTLSKCDLIINAISVFRQFLTWFSALANFSCSIAVLGNPNLPPPSPMSPLLWCMHHRKQGRGETTDYRQDMLHVSPLFKGPDGVQLSDSE